MSKKINKYYKEFSLFNTWCIMRIVVSLAPNHPWHISPPDLKNWIKNSTPFNTRFSCSMTIVLILSYELILFAVMRIIKEML